MPKIVKIKRSNVAGSTPTLSYGELGYNASDNRLFAGNAANQAVVVGSGGGGGSANIVEAATASGFPATGSAGTLYHATDVRRIYFWDSSGVYVEAGTSGGGGGASAASDDARWEYLKPAAPTSVTATAGNAQAVVSWTAPPVVVPPVTDYSVLFSANGGSTWTTATDAVSTATSATITSLTNGVAHVFRVAGINGIGTGAYSTASAAVTPIAGTPPNAPTSLTATGGNAQIALAWTAPSAPGTFAISGYTVEYTPSGGSAQTVSTGSTSASYTLTGLTNGTAYTVRVAGVSAAGVGAYTAASAAVTPTSAVFRAIPTLTSNTSNGTASANTSGGGAAWNLFDNSSTEYYTARNGYDTPKRFFQYTFADNSQSYIGGYTMTGVGNRDACVSSWELSGSNDGTNFTVIESRSVAWASGGQTQAFTLSSPANYSTYRWTLTPDGANDSVAGLAGVQLTAV